MFRGMRTRRRATGMRASSRVRASVPFSMTVCRVWRLRKSMPTSTSDPHPLLLVLGMGYTASRFVQSHRNLFTRIAATARQPEKAKALSAGSIWGIPFDGGEPSSDLLRAAAAASHVLVSIPPRENGDPALSALGPLLRENDNLRWIGYLSTTGIY